MKSFDLWFSFCIFAAVIVMVITVMAVTIVDKNYYRYEVLR